MKTRFDLEQEIMECWKLVDEVKEIDTELAESLNILYSMKFEKLWDTFTEVFQIDDYAPTRQETTDEG